MNSQFFQHHFKRHFNSVFSYVIYAALIGYFIFSGFSLNATELSALAVNIAIVDQANNTVSQQYSDDLQKYQILKIQLTDDATATDLLEREIIDLKIVIPPNYDPNDNDNKLACYYLNNNVIAPAVLDLLAVDLVPHVVEQRLVDVAQRYQVGDQATAKERFASYYKTLNANFDIEVLTPQLKSKLLGERALIVIENAKKTLSFAMFIILLIIVLPLSLRLKNSSEIKRRMALNEYGLIAYAFDERRFSYPYIQVLWIVATVSVGIAQQLAFTLIFSLIVCGIMILFFYYELLRLLMRGERQNYLASLLALVAIILPAIIGGVFFASDLLPPAISAVAKYLPFNVLENFFYNGLEKGYPAMPDIIMMFAYSFLDGLLVLANLFLEHRFKTD